MTKALIIIETGSYFEVYLYAGRPDRNHSFIVI